MANNNLNAANHKNMEYSFTKLSGNRKDPARKQGLCSSAIRGCKNSSAYSLIEKSLSHKSLCGAKVILFIETNK